MFAFQKPHGIESMVGARRVLKRSASRSSLISRKGVTRDVYTRIYEGIRILPPSHLAKRYVKKFSNPIDPDNSVLIPLRRVIIFINVFF